MYTERKKTVKFNEINHLPIIKEEINEQTINSVDLAKIIPTSQDFIEETNSEKINNILDISNDYQQSVELPSFMSNLSIIIILFLRKLFFAKISKKYKNGYKIRFLI